MFIGVLCVEERAVQNNQNRNTHIVLLRPGSDAVLHMNRIKFEFRPTQINLDRRAELIQTPISIPANLVGDPKAFLCTLTIFSVCRNSQRMPTDVTDALLEIFMKEGKMDRTKAQELLRTLESTRHFQSETWS